ncbi:MAG: hypothetical protein A3K19_16470 [Lentisphaerae bacterium RIFOXYB12_FULL_65_16]|nr:MAG: hypothetical protein A3K18_24580 [Lentisphaerae bacterium RIFOXYA12_64_32]OGV89038.1 MAG: hypothetical protein A3K19_16470 [Lentisphaerae bacterium RIFOXYB12_FULL_65_16]
MANPSYILRGALVIDPSNGVHEVRDIAVCHGRIVPVSAAHGAAVVELPGLVLTPGLIDLHTHLREPGQSDKETIASGTRAAAAGGYTTVVAMPNTQPPIDTCERLAEVLERVRRNAVVRVLQTAALSRDRKGRELTDARALAGAGAGALTDDGSCIQDESLMRRALEQARAAGLPVIDHCEDETLAASGVMHPGVVARELGLAGKSAASEEVVVARNGRLALETGWPVHMQHLSSAGSVNEVRQALSRGAPVSAEVTPHNLALTEEACRTCGTNAKMNPPLRTEADRQALIAGLQDGTIGVIATDHAPHTQAEKARDFATAPFGVIGLESAVPVCLTLLYHSGILGLSQLVSKLTLGPKQVLGLSQGSLECGAPADITILDMNREFVLDASQFRSLARNCPFHGWNCRGKAVATMVAGEWVFSELPHVTGRV